MMKSLPYAERHPCLLGVLWALVTHLCSFLLLFLATYFFENTVLLLLPAYVLPLLSTLLLVAHRADAWHRATSLRAELRLPIASLLTLAVLLVTEAVLMTQVDLSVLEPNTSFFPGLAYTVGWLAALVGAALELLIVTIQIIATAYRLHKERRPAPSSPDKVPTERPSDVPEANPWRQHPVRIGVTFALLCHVITWLSLVLPTYFNYGETGMAIALFLLVLQWMVLFCLNLQAHSETDTFREGVRFSVCFLLTSTALLIAEGIYIVTADLGALEPHASFLAGLVYILYLLAWLFAHAADIVTVLLQSLVWAYRARREHNRLQFLRGTPMKKIAVITGASSGMGRDFARRLDAQQDFDEIWLIARRRERLEEMANELRAPVRAIALDLTREESIAEYSALLAAESPRIAVLVNAAGFGRFGKTEDVPLADQYRMIDLNAKALVGMTLASLPCLGEGSQVYQLGSMSSFQPVPYINTYGATKAFVLSFTRALGVEWKSRGIRLMAVCPHWVKTEFFDHAVKDDTISYYNKFYTSDEVVVRALRDMKRGRDVSICGFSARAQANMVKLLPHKLVMKIWCKQQKK